jgi:hypothetical protein
MGLQAAELRLSFFPNILSKLCYWDLPKMFCIPFKQDSKVKRRLVISKLDKTDLFD